MQINNPEFQEFVHSNKHFWWWIPENSLNNLKIESIVEGTLNYGDIAEIKQLLKLIGIALIVETFFKTTRDKNKRINYLPPTLNFFNLNFIRHVRKNFNRGTKAIN